MSTGAFNICVLYVADSLFSVPKVGSGNDRKSRPLYSPVGAQPERPKIKESDKGNNRTVFRMFL
jgi:hypothetical protein